MLALMAAAFLSQGCLVSHSVELTAAVPMDKAQHAERLETKGCTFYLLGALPISDASKRRSGSSEHRVATLIEEAGGRQVTGITAETWMRAWPVGLHRCTFVSGTVLP